MRNRLYSNHLLAPTFFVLSTISLVACVSTGRSNLDKNGLNPTSTYVDNKKLSDLLLGSVPGSYEGNYPPKEYLTRRKVGRYSGYRVTLLTDTMAAMSISNELSERRLRLAEKKGKNKHDAIVDISVAAFSESSPIFTYFDKNSKPQDGSNGLYCFEVTKIGTDGTEYKNSVFEASNMYVFAFAPKEKEPQSANNFNQSVSALPPLPLMNKDSPVYSNKGIYCAPRAYFHNTENENQTIRLLIANRSFTPNKTPDMFDFEWRLGDKAAKGSHLLLSDAKQKAIADIKKLEELTNNKFEYFPFSSQLTSKKNEAINAALGHSSLKYLKKLLPSLTHLPGDRASLLKYALNYNGIAEEDCDPEIAKYLIKLKPSLDKKALRFIVADKYTSASDSDEKVVEENYSTSLEVDGGCPEISEFLYTWFPSTREKIKAKTLKLSNSSLSYYSSKKAPFLTRHMKVHNLIREDLNARCDQKNMAACVVADSYNVSGKLISSILNEAALRRRQAQKRERKNLDDLIDQLRKTRRLQTKQI